MNVEWNLLQVLKERGTNSIKKEISLAAKKNGFVSGVSSRIQ